MLEEQPQRLVVGLVGQPRLLLVAGSLRLLRERIVVGAHRPRRRHVGHAKLENHLARERRHLLEVVGGAVRDPAEHDLLRGPAGERHLHHVDELLLRAEVALVVGDTRELTLDRFARMRPVRAAVREVARPQEAIETDLMTILHAVAVGDEHVREVAFEVHTRRRLVAAGLIPAVLLHRAARARALIREQVLEALERFDLLLAPTSPHPAPAISFHTAPVTSKEEAARRFFGRRSYTTPASLAGVPAISVPCGFTAAGLPDYTSAHSIKLRQFISLLYQRIQGPDLEFWDSKGQYSAIV